MTQTVEVLKSGRLHWYLGYQKSVAVHWPGTYMNFRSRKITLKVPKSMAMADIDAALHIRLPWMRAFIKNVAENFQPQRLQKCRTLPFEGVDRVLNFGHGVGSVALMGDDLLVPGHARTAALPIQKWYRGQARDRLVKAVDNHARSLGVEPARIAIRDTKSRWGSCSSRKTLSFSWRVVMAPAPVLNYLAAHEVAHLRHMDHSLDFWRCVEHCVEDWPLWRDWLTLNGSRLMRYQFD